MTKSIPICATCGLTPEQVIEKSMLAVSDRIEAGELFDIPHAEDGTFFGASSGEFYCRQHWDERRAAKKG